MSSVSKPDRDELLGRLWDALQDSGALGSDDVDAEDVEVITRIHGAEDVPSPDDELIQRMWGSIETGTFGSVVAQTVVPSLNRHPAATELADPATILDSPRLMPAVGAPAARNRMAAASSRIVRIAAIGAAAGFITGFITLGGGSRIAMRIAAMLSEDELRGTLTENDQRVGEITLSGTWELLLTGGFFGLGLGLAFVLIRAYLPGSGRRRVLTSGAVFFAVCGFATLEGGGNRDYERFGIAGLNVCLFTILPLLFGLLIVPVFDRLDRRIGPQLPRLSRSPRALLVSGALLFGFVVSIQGMMVLLIFPPLQLFVATPVLVALAHWAGNRFSVSPTSGISLWMSRAVLALPCVVGLTMTAIAVGRIM